MKAQETRKIYHYKAITPEGFVVKGRMSAAGKHDLYNLLAEKRLSLINCRCASTVLNGLLEQRSKISSQELLDFCMHMQYMDKAGVPLLDALRDAIENQPRLRWAIDDMIDHIKKGLMLSQAMALHPGIFPEIFVEIIRLSEQSGRLFEGFEKLYEHYKWREQYQKDLLQTIRYPLVVLGLSIVLIWILSSWVIPQLQELMMMSGNEIPLTSIILLEFSQNFSTWAPVIVLATALGLIFGYILRFISQGYAIIIDRNLLRIPILGDILRTRDLTFYIHFLRVSLSSGIDFLEALEYSLGSVKNLWLSQCLRKLSNEIKEGKALSSAFKDAGIFDSSTIRLIQVGEITGHLQPLLVNLEAYQMKRYRVKMTKLLNTAQPTIFAIVGLLLLWVVLSAFYPMYDFILTMAS